MFTPETFLNQDQIETFKNMAGKYFSWYVEDLKLAETEEGAFKITWDHMGQNSCSFLLTPEYQDFEVWGGDVKIEELLKGIK